MYKGGNMMSFEEIQPDPANNAYQTQAFFEKIKDEMQTISLEGICSKFAEIIVNSLIERFLEKVSLDQKIVWTLKQGMKILVTKFFMILLKDCRKYINVDVDEWSKEKMQALVNLSDLSTYEKSAMNLLIDQMDQQLTKLNLNDCFYKGTKEYGEKLCQSYISQNSEKKSSNDE